MFKPHYGKCTKCGNDDRLIVIKKGWCQYCNHEHKQDKKKERGIVSTVKMRKPTGEKHVFEEVLESFGDNPIHCFVCGKRLTFLTHHNYAHILRKGTYPRFRLNPNNIRIMCYNIDGTGCHTKFDFTPRSGLKGREWEKVFELEEKLKKEYNGR